MIFYNALDDEILLSLLKEGDNAAFEQIYHRYWNGLYQAAFRMTGDENICEDLVQDIFVWLWNNRLNHDIRHLQAYLYTAVKLRMLNVIRNGKIRDSVFKQYALNTKQGINESHLEVRELEQMIDQFIASLPEQAKKIFQLSREHSLSYREISHHLGLSEKTVKNQIYITLKKFRMVFAKHISSLMF